MSLSNIRAFLLLVHESLEYSDRHGHDDNPGLQGDRNYRYRSGLIRRQVPERRTDEGAL
ncbi:hypothetical protein ACFPTY_06005 [Halomonas beimenensis]|uniref:hypothetical protein n=1 Tax=Halomonas beimenensis TaxID=475662 RepID=UPI00187D5E65|nr:hypothetical protein [Halomonas beimenensis]